MLVIRRYVPESPRWLTAHDHSRRAETVVQDIESKVARLGGSQLPEAKPQPIGAPGRVGLTTLFSRVYARRTMMLWTLWFFAQLGASMARRAAASEGFPGHQIAVLYHSDLACGHPGFGLKVRAR